MVDRLVSLDHIAFQSSIPEVANLLVQSFSQTPPWSDIGLYPHLQTTMERLRGEAKAGNFRALAYESEEGMILGVCTCREIETQQIIEENFPAALEIGSFLEIYMRVKQISALICFDRTFVSPEHQRQGIGSKLRREMLDVVRQQYPDGALIFTCHMDSNAGIIESSKKLGFVRTGIRSGQDPFTVCEYWIMRSPISVLG